MEGILAADVTDSERSREWVLGNGSPLEEEEKKPLLPLAFRRRLRRSLKGLMLVASPPLSLVRVSFAPPSLFVSQLQGLA